jgi:uncharacterized protein (UPF0335 family)
MKTDAERIELLEKEVKKLKSLIKEIIKKKADKQTAYGRVVYKNGRRTNKAL